MEDKYDWNDPLPDKFRSDWVNFFQQLYEVETTTFERCIKPKQADGNPNLVVFSDESGEAYGATAYIQWKVSDDRYDAQLITSKNRIAPIKVIDVVRLELCAAVLS